MRNRYLITAKRHKNTQDLTMDGRYDWLPRSLYEEEQKRLSIARLAEKDGIEEYGAVPHYELPKGFYPTQERLTWFEALSGWEWKKLLEVIKP